MHRSPTSGSLPGGEPQRSLVGTRLAVNRGGSLCIHLLPTACRPPRLRCSPERLEVREEIGNVLVSEPPPGHGPVQGLSGWINSLRDGALDEGISVGRMLHLLLPLLMFALDQGS